MRLQFLRSVAVSVGMALATSCFAIVAGMTAAAGSWAILAIAVSTLMALAVAQAVGRLAKRFPSAPGIRTYTKAAFGNTASLFFVFMYLLVIALIAGIECNVFADIVQHVFPDIGRLMIIAGLFLLIVAMNISGYEFSKRMQLGMVAAVTSGLSVLTLYGITHADFSAALSRLPPAARLDAMPTAVVSAFFLFAGFEWVTAVQSGSRKAAEQLPRVLVTAVILLGAIYIVFATAAVAHLEPATLATTNEPQLLLARKLWGEPGVWGVLVISALAVLTAFNAGILGASRLVYGLAREGFLPRALTLTVDFSGAPALAILLITALSFGSALAVLAMQNNYLVGATAGVVICICYCALLAASLKLDKSNPDSLRGHTRFTSPVALLLMLALVAALLFQKDALRETAIVIVAAGLLLLAAYVANGRGLRTADQRRTAQL